MNRSRYVLCVAAILAFACAAPRAQAQDTAQKKVTPLKVQVVISEFDGEKKVGSLPYVFYVMADSPRDDTTSVRMGLRVPIRTGGSPQPGATYQYQYQDVGTDLDCHARSLADGSFGLVLSINRSSVYSAGADEGKDGKTGGVYIPPDQLIVQQFRTGTQVFIKDGQTVQSSLAADPINGHVLKVDVTVNVVK